MEKHKRAPSLLLKIAVAASISLMLVTGGIVWALNSNRSRHTYKGPVDTISTGVIGEYASLIYIAQVKGYFNENGLNVTLKDYASGPEALSALLKGEVDTAMASDFAGVRNSFNGEDFKILANMSSADAFTLVARKDRNIATVSDFRGKTIGLTRKTVGEFYIGQFLTFNRLSLKDIKIVDLSQADLIEALASGKIDAAALFEPNAYKAKVRLEQQSSEWSLQNGQQIYSLLYGSGSFIRNKPDAVTRYMKAITQAEKFVATHDLEARDIVANYLQYDSQYIDYVWPRFTFAVSLDQELIINMENEASWAIENHLTASKKIPNYLRFIYMDPLLTAKPSGVTIIR